MEKEKKEMIGYLAVFVLGVSTLVILLDYLMGRNITLIIFLTAIGTLFLTGIMVDGYCVWKWNRNYRLRKEKKWPHLLEWHRE